MNAPFALSPKEAAEALGVSRATIYRLHDSGRLRFVKVGSRTLIPTSLLLELLDGVTKPAQGMDQ